jgi:secreted trypsin-like serine protease
LCGVVSLKKLLGVLLLLPLLAIAELEPVDSRGIAPRIINGTAAGATEHEYFVSLLNVYDWQSDKFYTGPGLSGDFSWNPFCGASYIGSGKVITAAHCVNGYRSNSSLYLLVGNYSNLNSTGNTGMQYEYCKNTPSYTGRSPNNQCIGLNSNNMETYGEYKRTGKIIYTGVDDENTVIEVPVKDIQIHPLYNTRNLQFDIAIITLPTIINNLALALPSMDLFDYLARNSSAKNVQVIGHGDTISDTNRSTFSASATLLNVNLTPRTSEECLRSNIGGIYNQFTMICAGDPGYDSCQGDSGGPLIDPVTDTLLGVVSWGASQCGIDSTNAYGVYTDIYNLRDWIETGNLELNLDANTKRLANGQVHRLGTGSMPILLLFALSSILITGRKRG